MTTLTMVQIGVDGFGLWCAFFGAIARVRPLMLLGAGILIAGVPSLMPMLGHAP